MTSDPDSISDLIKTLIDAYTDADDKIKQCERYILASPSVAVNQMRYAGSHLLKCIKGEIEKADYDNRHESIKKAINHCKRAYFDALETLIFAQLEFISDFQNLCRSKRNIETVYPDYVADFSALVTIQERLQSFRMVQSFSEEDEKELLDISERVSKLKRKILRLKVTVEKLDSVEIADEVILSVQQFLLSFTATVLGTTIGIAGMAIAVWNILPDIWWIRISAVVALLLIFVFSCKKFYGWSAMKLLTENQRRLLSDRLGISWT